MGRFTHPVRKFGDRRYALYDTFSSKRQAETEAKRMRPNGWLVRIVHSSIGYDLYTTHR